MKWETEREDPALDFGLYAKKKKEKKLYSPIYRNKNVQSNLCVGPVGYETGSTRQKTGGQRRRTNKNDAGPEAKLHLGPR